MYLVIFGVKYYPDSFTMFTTFCSFSFSCQRSSEMKIYVWIYLAAALCVHRNENFRIYDLNVFNGKIFWSEI